MRRVAVVGAGIGAQHLEGYLALPDRFTVSHVCDLDRDRAQPLCDRSGAAYAPDLDSVLADESVDIVDICLPPHLHFSAVEAVLKAGRHAVCEKPLVASLAEADALIALSAETGKQVFPVFQYRFGRAASQLRALSAAGLTGKPYVASLETHWNRDAAYYAVPWRGTWKTERGGAILGHAIHIHDWLGFVFGPVAQVYADLATRVNDIEVEDCAALSIRMASGALVTSSVTLGAANDTSRLRFCFEGLTAESGSNPYKPAEDSWTFTARAPVTQAEVDAVLAGVGEAPAGYAGLFTALADALDGKPGAEVTLEDGRRSLEFVSAVYQSHRSNAPVRLPLDRHHPLYRNWLPEAL
ncbi:Gfo/Idh/MocA family protein [Frigidibacter sp. ROC022]|uniref:Gfo/Idh/MocA family protein n=1 Tax=Frigidibacter sp. ROC022 TaxID=2971796 RepID=UPI00215A769C|nr:Gfo/Idh/MocA family oxidoreductase [Frigidibacter sp. ROC022]MCR8723974.1 Gfo/Idh/MocA family oxidoreductase [Frigidibacter sp. ROC022]